MRPAARAAGPDDLEGYARLCPECIGRAGENQFLRFRLKRGPRGAGRGRARRPYADAAPRPGRPRPPAGPPRDLDVRCAPTTPHAPPSTTTSTCAAAATSAAPSTTWRGRPSSTRRRAGSTSCRWPARSWNWPPAPAGGRRCWRRRATSRSPTRTRSRSDRAASGWRRTASGRRAVRDAWEPPDRQVDGLFAGFWLSHVPRHRLPDSSRSPGSGSGPAAASPSSIRARSAGRAPGSRARRGRPDVAVATARRRPPVRVVKVFYEPDELAPRSRQAGFERLDVRETAAFFLLGKRDRPLTAAPGAAGTRRYTPAVAPLRSHDRDDRLRRDGRSDDRRAAARPAWSSPARSSRATRGPSGASSLPANTGSARSPRMPRPSRAPTSSCSAIKPQMLARVARELRGCLRDGQLVLSIIAGATTAALTGSWGTARSCAACPTRPPGSGAA